MSSARQQLLRLLAERSFRLGQFTLSSGATSDYYIDCRTTTLSAAGARLTGLAVLQEIATRGWQVQAIGGLTMGADPIVTAVAVLSAAGQPDGGIAWPIDGFLVRKTEKQHGTGQRIEGVGFNPAGARVLIVDDVCTTGASTVQAIEAARAASMEVVAALCLVDREEQGGRANVEKAAAASAHPAPFVALFTAREIREEHLRQRGDRGATDFSPTAFAVSGACEMCGRPAVTNVPRSRCDAHRS
jgi:orotate phosphoribosyltransferase